VSRRGDPDDLSIVIHELRNPLVGIDAAARVLANELGSHPASGRASAIASEARHMLALLDGLADAEAAAAGRLRSRPRAADLSRIARGAVAAAQFPDHRVALRGDAEPLMVMADEGRIRQVLANLLANAAQYSPAGSTIEVSVRAQRRRAVASVEVRDHGPGLTAADRRRLFKKFARLSTSGGTRGSGLGLFICRAIVADHGGELRHANAAGGGSAFTFTLPLALSDSSLGGTPRSDPGARSRRFAPRSARPGDG